MKVVINNCYGGFFLSKAAYDYLGLAWDGVGICTSPSNMEALGLPAETQDYDISFRSLPKLVECVEKLGDEASGRFARLKIVEVPDNVEAIIEGRGGKEWVGEKHRVWE